MPVSNSNRSPSPSSRSNPHSRNSDPNSSIRKSFSGSPFHKPSALTNPRSFNPPTPANSPSGFGRRLSVGKEGTDEKENDQNIKPVKLRASATGPKNFMAPTISAAYKLTPPREKVLVERNEPVRTSDSLSEEKVTFFSSTDYKIEAQMESTGNDLTEKEVVLEPPSVSKAMKRVTFADSILVSENSTEFEEESVLFDSDRVVTDLSPTEKKSCDSISLPIIAPLDADPSLPPYDPKTNYLSPRPQFLHYKPNPRIEVLLNKEKGLDDNGGVKRLEDNFASFENNSSGTDGMVELLDCDDSQGDSEDSSSVDIEPQRVKKEDIYGSDSLICGGSNDHENSEEVVEGKREEKKGIFTRLRFMCLLVVLLVSCYSVSPGTNSTILKALNISQLHQPAAVVDLVKANFNVFTERFQQFSIESMSHLSLLIKNLGQGDKLSPLQFMNLTELQRDLLVGGYLKVQQGSENSPESLEWDDLEEENIDWDDLEEEKSDETAESFEEKTYGESVSDSSSEHEQEIHNDLLLTEALSLAASPIIPDDDPICNQEEAASQLHKESQDFVSLAPEVHEVSSESGPGSYEGNVNLHFDANVEPLQDYVNPEHHAPIVLEVHEASIESNLENVEGNVNLESETNMEPLPQDINLKTPSDSISPPNVKLPSDMGPSPRGYSRTKTSAYYFIGIGALMLAVASIAFAAFINKSRGNGSERNLGVDTDQLLNKKTSHATSAMEPLYQEKLSAFNWPVVDDVEESCSSEMSSFQRSSYQSHNNRLRSENEAQSGERRHAKYSKRESFCSSDISLGGGSASYGSFTTYERIPIKNATGDDEVVTPVRRSSRLRRQVTS